MLIQASPSLLVSPRSKLALVVSLSPSLSCKFPLRRASHLGNKIHVFEVDVGLSNSHETFGTQPGKPLILDCRYTHDLSAPLKRKSLLVVE